jgi:HEAT repeat protein
VRELLKYHSNRDTPPMLLHGPELDIQFGAACSLLRIVPGDYEALSVLKNVLRSSDKQQRLLALKACAWIGLKEKPLIPDLIDSLKDKELQDWGADALAEVGPDAKEAIPILQKILLAEQSNHTCDNAAARALVGIGKAGIPALLTVARQGSAAREAAIVSLTEFESEAPQVVPLLVAALFDEETRWMATKACGYLGRQAKAARLPLLAVHLFDLIIHRQEKELLLMERWALHQICG